MEACRPAQLSASATPLANAAEDTRLDGPMQATQSLLIAQVQAGNDLMMLSERLVSSMNRDLVKQLDKVRSSAPAATRWNLPSLSVAVLMNPCPSATRQVNQFACTNMSAALDARGQACTQTPERHPASLTRRLSFLPWLCGLCRTTPRGWPGVCGVECDE